MGAGSRVCIGKILGAHGVKGLAKVASFTQNPEDVAAYGPVSDETGARVWTLSLHGWNRDHFLARFSGVETREQVEALRGTTLHVPRKAFPEVEGSSFYYADLIGLEARLEDGTPFGKITNVTNYGASDILEIARASGGPPLLIPFADAFVPEVRVKEGWVRIDPPVVDDGNEERGHPEG